MRHGSRSTHTFAVHPGSGQRQPARRSICAKFSRPARTLAAHSGWMASVRSSSGATSSSGQKSRLARAGRRLRRWLSTCDTPACCCPTLTTDPASARATSDASTPRRCALLAARCPAPPIVQAVPRRPALSAAAMRSSAARESTVALDLVRLSTDWTPPGGPAWLAVLAERRRPEPVVRYTRRLERRSPPALGPPPPVALVPCVGC